MRLRVETRQEHDLERVRTGRRPCAHAGRDDSGLAVVDAQGPLRTGCAAMYVVTAHNPCRGFWVNGQVLTDTGHLGMTIKTDDSSALTDNVAGASNPFGPKLVEPFGGKLAFDDSKGEEYGEPPLPGMYR